MANIKYITDFLGVTANESYYKMKEELREIAVEVKNKNMVAEVQEECDLIQSIYTRWMNLGFTKDDIKGVWETHYKKETLRGRHVEEIPGQNTEEKIIENLLKVIAKLERENKELKGVKGNE